MNDLIAGVNSYTHDCSVVALRKNGEIFSAYEEERISRQKHHLGFVFGGIGPEKALLTTTYNNTIHTIAHSKIIDYSAKQNNHAQSKFVSWANSVSDTANTIYLEHHLCHVASTYYPSKFDCAYICTLDAQGDGVSCTISIGKGNEIVRILSVPGMRSVCSIFSYLAECMRLGKRAEGSLMALADFGINKLFIPPLFEHKYYTLNINEKVLNQLLDAIYDSSSFEDLANIAQHIQESFVSAILSLINNTCEDTSIRNLALAGGGFLNCKLVQKISDSQRWDNVYTNAAMGDSGTALGAAILSLPNPRSVKFEHAYLGTSLSKKYTETRLKKLNVQYSKSDSSEISELLISGKIGGLFIGSAEFGARALGHRSIVGDPRIFATKTKINQIKKRQSWRPIAPSILHEFGSEWIEKYSYSPFMTQSYYVKNEKLSLIPSAIHIDGSARLQSVKDTNDPYYKIIYSFYEKTGVPILCNSSFNVQEPIIDTIDDAIRLLYSTEIDFLYCNGYLIKKD